MILQPDPVVVRDFLARVARRLTWVSAARGATAGLAVAIALALLGWPRPDALGSLVAVGAAACVAGIFTLRHAERGKGFTTPGKSRSFASLRMTEREAALGVERRVPESRNLILTAHELSAHPADRYVPNLVFADAARLVQRLDIAALFPERQATAVLIAALAGWLLVIARPLLPLPALGGGGVTAALNAIPAIDAIDVTIEPPAYTGRARQTVHDPARIEALAGSRLDLTVRARAGRVAMETLAARDTLMKRGSTFTGTLVAGADGYVAVEPTTGDHTGARRLIGLTVVPDEPPRVRIVTPGHDQRLPDGHRSLDVGIEASDDIGLASLTLRFTKVSGSGERFTFVESEVPLAITRRDERTWTAHAAWALDTLKLEPGDMVVYRAVATDHRPAGGATESDSFIAEILAPGGIAAPGFAIDPEQDRYAVSQQMVILKTERLLARRPTMAADDFASESQQIAAEQRKVRAEFVFMLGGELADAPDLIASMTDIDETQEAQGEADILAGRNANAGHVALLRAIRAMSRAAASLAVAEPTPALPYERTALAQIESAFSRSRILLRALTTRERLDLSRRLTGVLTDAARDVQPSAVPEANSRTVALRKVLSDIATLAGTTKPGAGPATRASALAERVLRVDPSSKSLQDISAQLGLAAAAMADHRDDSARASLDRASIGVVAVLRGELPDAPTRSRSLGDSRMSGALADELRSRRPP